MSKSTKASSSENQKPAPAAESKARAKKIGLRKGQIRILEVLAKAKGTLTRVQIAEKSKNTNGQAFNLMGSTNPEQWAATEARVGYQGLITLKLVRGTQVQVPDGEGKEWRFEITAAGRKALQSLAKR